MEPQPTRLPAPVHAPKAKPDPRPMRVALGFGGVAALSALAAAIVLPPRPVTSAPVAVDQQALAPSDNGGQPATSPGTSPATATATRQILYVQLAPGQTAPPGATVIDAAVPTAGAAGVRAPAPITKTTTTQVAPVAPPPPPVIAPPPPPKPAPTPIIIKTTQSGTVVP
jgi:hypothetical protein